MAPEQAEGLEAGPAADLYSLALVLYEALTGINPVRIGTAARHARRLGAHLPPLRRQRRDLPRRAGPRDRHGAAPASARARRRDRAAAGPGGRARAWSTTTPAIVADPWTRDRRRHRARRHEAPASSRRPAARAASRRRRRRRREPPPVPTWVVPRASAALGAGATAGWLAEPSCWRRRPLAAAGRGRAGRRADAAAARAWAGWRPRPAVCGISAAQGHTGGAVVVLIAMLIPVVLMLRSPTAWPLAAAAPGARPGRPGRRLAGAGGAGRIAVAPGGARLRRLDLAAAGRAARRPRPLPARCRASRRRRESGSARRATPCTRCWRRCSAPARSPRRRCGRWAPLILPWLVRGRSPRARSRAAPWCGRRSWSPPAPPRRRPPAAASRRVGGAQRDGRGGGGREWWPWRRRRSPSWRRRRPFGGVRGRISVAWIRPEGASNECAEKPREQDRRPRRRHVQSCLPVRGAPGGDRPQAGARDGGAQVVLGLAHLRAQRVPGLPVSARPRAVRRLRGCAGLASWPGTCSSMRVASSWC